MLYIPQCQKIVLLSLYTLSLSTFVRFSPVQAALLQSEHVFDDLSQADKAVVKKALSTLSNMGGSREHLPFLLRALQHPDPEIRMKAVFTLENRGAKVASPELRKALNDPHPAVRRAAASVLGHFGDNQDIAGIKKAMLKEQNTDLLSDFLLALEHHGQPEALAILLSYAQSPNKNHRVIVARALAKSQTTHLPLLKTYLQDKHADLRYAAVQTLLTIFPEQVMPDLILALEDPDSGVRELVAQGLANRVDERLQPVWRRYVLDSESTLSNIALNQLQKYPDPSLESYLLQHLRGPDEQKQYKAALAMGSLKMSVALPELRNLLQSGNENLQLRSIAAVSLGLLGEKEAIPDLIRSLNDPDITQYLVLEALSKLQAEEAYPHFLRALKSDDSTLQQIAIAGLKTLRAKSAIPHLKAVLQDNEYESKREAAELLYEWGQKESLLVLVRQGLVGDSSYEKSGMIDSIVDYQLQQYYPELIQSLKDDSWMVRTNAMDAIETLKYKAANPALIQVLMGTYSFSERIAALNILEKIGDANILPDLQQALDIELDYRIQEKIAAVMNTLNRS